MKRCLSWVKRLRSMYSHSVLELKVWETLMRSARGGRYNGAYKVTKGG